MARAIGSCSRAGLKAPKGFQLYEGDLTGLWKTFWGQPETLDGIHPGSDIEFSYGPLMDTTNRLYVFKQYAYLRDRIDAFRARETGKKRKDCVIVTGTPGIGKAFYLLSPSD